MPQLWTGCEGDDPRGGRYSVGMGLGMDEACLGDYD